MLLTKIDPDTIVGIVFGIVGAAGAVPGVAMIVQHLRNRRARSQNSTGDLETGQSSSRVSSHEDDHMTLLRLLQVGLDNQAGDEEVIQRSDHIPFVHLHHGIPLVIMNSSVLHPFSFHTAFPADGDTNIGSISMPTTTAISENLEPSATNTPSITTQDISHRLSTTSVTPETSTPTSRKYETPQPTGAFRNIFESSAGPFAEDNVVSSSKKSDSANFSESQVPSFSSSSSPTPIRALCTESRQTDQMDGT